MKHLILLILSILSTGVQAGQEKKLSKTDLSEIYNKSSQTNIDAIAYHDSDSTTTVFLKFNLKDLLNVSSDKLKDLNLTINYDFYYDWKDRLPADSGTITFERQSIQKDQQTLILSLPLPMSYGIRGVFQFTIQASNNSHLNAFVEVDKTNRTSRQNFLLLSESGEPLFLPAASPQEPFIVKYHQRDLNELKIRYYNQEFPIAKPPFAIEKQKPHRFDPDSIYSISLEDGQSKLLRFVNPGFYHIQVEVDKPEGITMFVFRNSFPQIDNPASALAPLRYLTTEKEFLKLLEYENQKIAVDEFWLERASQIQKRARKMISRFYERVELANRLFTSYLEGWKTDRGLIYIIYGPPSEVYRDGDDEEWVYGEKTNPLSIKFYFSRVENPFTSNDFHLNRSTVYKSSWYIAIENWRRE